MPCDCKETAFFKQLECKVVSINRCAHMSQPTCSVLDERGRLPSRDTTEGSRRSFVFRKGYSASLWLCHGSVMAWLLRLLKKYSDPTRLHHFGRKPATVRPARVVRAWRLAAGI